ncbi:MAG: ATP-dependent DNA helicase RecG [Ignavibacteria bacterium CG1_02_37_35]|nr:MAG: ATP-dependent DNA helicase RecG [Ignavibacteria bacterium CG1_02_37_35]
MSTQSNNQLDQSIQYIKTVGPKRAETFAKIGIRTIKDLLFYFPTRYLDRRNLLTSNKAYKVVEDGYDGEITVIGKVVDKESRNFKGKTILNVKLRDEDGYFGCVWFQGAKYFQDKFNSGEIFAISAKPTISRYGELQFVHPDFDRISEDESQFFYNTGKIIPFYRIPKELKEKNIGDLSFRKIISFAIEEHLSLVEETLPQQLRAKHHLQDLQDALRQMHFPESDEQLNEAKKRFTYEELFYIETLVALRRNNYKEKLKGLSLPLKTNLVKDFIKSLSFELTSAQKKVLKEIFFDMKNEKPMNRLLQGDVGSGKTIVALIAMLAAVDNGYQAAVMVPTEILADQHAKNISKLFQHFHSLFPQYEIKPTLIIGGQKKSLRNKNLEEIALQEADIIIGTHALFEEEVHFKKLGLVIIDEQHRFGVAQRARFASKGTVPEIILMSATPIPRTLSMTIYGDLDVSTIDEMPENRVPIKTYLRGESKLPDIYKFIVDKTKEGVQTFIVYPLVEESEKLELKAATTLFEELKETYFKEVNVGLIHGRMKWQEKEEAMLLFAAKKFDVLISTTVIEVGIDIPGANIILIDDAHRFGLSQLHQLRGRVGRGTVQAYCILVTKDEFAASSARLPKDPEYLSPVLIEKYKSAIRLQTMVKQLDGFKIAEVDMKLRGPGDIFGIKQSGFPELKYSDILKDGDLLLHAKTDAFEIVASDPQLLQEKQAVIRKNLLAHYSENLKYAKVG